MNRIVLKSRVSRDGILQLTVPVGASSADEEVQVTIESVVEPSEMTIEEWQRGLLELAGSWKGPFERPDQGELQERDSFQ